MNKKTLSLAASLFTAATFGVSAQNLVSSGMTNGNYYLLGSGSTAEWSGFLFQSGDSLIELDGPLDELTGAQRAYGQWMVEWTSNSGTPVYTFKNKATGKTLSLPKGGKATPVGGEINDFDWMGNVSNTGSSVCVSNSRQGNAGTYQLYTVWVLMEDIEADNNTSLKTLIGAGKVWDRLEVLAWVNTYTIQGKYTNYLSGCLGLSNSTGQNVTKALESANAIKDLFISVGVPTEKVEALITAISKFEQGTSVDLSSVSGDEYVAACNAMVKQSEEIKCYFSPFNLSGAENAPAYYSNSNADSPYYTDDPGTPYEAKKGIYSVSSFQKTPLGGDGTTAKKVKYKAGTIIVAEDAHLQSAPFEAGTKFFYNEATTPAVISQIKGATVSVVSDDKTAIAKEFVKELQLEGEEASQTCMVFDFGETLAAVTGNVLAGRRFQAVERNINITEEGITLTDTESAESSNYSRAILIKELGTDNYLCMMDETYDGSEGSNYFKLTLKPLKDMTGSVTSSFAPGSKFWRGDGVHSAAYVWDVSYNPNSSAVTIKPRFLVKRKDASKPVFEDDTDIYGKNAQVYTNTSYVISYVSAKAFEDETCLTILTGTTASPVAAAAVGGGVSRDEVLRRDSMAVVKADSIAAAKKAIADLAAKADSLAQAKKDSIIRAQDSIIHVQDSIIAAKDSIYHIQDSIAKFKRDSIAQAAQDSILAAKDSIAKVNGNIAMRDSILAVQDSIIKVRDSIAKAQDSISKIQRDSLSALKDSITRTRAYEIAKQDSLIRACDSVAKAKQDSITKAANDSIAKYNSDVAKKDAIIIDYQKRIAKQDSLATAEKNKLTAERDSLSSLRNREIAKKDSIIKINDSIAKAKQDSISKAALDSISKYKSDAAKRDSLIAASTKLLKEQDSISNAKQDSLTALKDSIAKARNSEIAKKDSLIKVNDSIAKAKQDSISKAASDSIAKYSGDVAKRDTIIAAYKKLVDEQDSIAKAERDSLTAVKDSITKAYNNKISAKDSLIKVNDSIAKAKQDSISKAASDSIAKYGGDVAKRDSVIAAYKKLVAKQDSIAKAKQDSIKKAASDSIAKYGGDVAKRDSIIAARDSAIKANDNIAKAKQDSIKKAANDSIAKYNGDVAKRDSVIAAYKKLVAEQERIAKAKQDSIKKAANDSIAKYSGNALKLDSIIAARDSAIKANDSIAKAKQDSIKKAANDSIAKYNGDIKALNGVIASRDSAIAANAEIAKAKQDSLTAVKDSITKVYNSDMAKKDSTIAAHDSIAKAKQDSIIAAARDSITKANGNIALLDSIVNARDSIIKVRDKELKEQDSLATAEKNKLTAERDSISSLRDREIAAKDSIIAAHDSIAKAKQDSLTNAASDSIAKCNDDIEALKRIIAARDSAIKANDSIAKAKQDSLTALKDNLINDYNGKIAAKDSTIAANARIAEAKFEELAAAARDSIAKYNGDLAKKDSIIAARDSLLKEQERLAIAMRDSIIAARDSIIAALNSTIATKDSIIAAGVPIVYIVESDIYSILFTHNKLNPQYNGKYFTADGMKSEDEVDLNEDARTQWAIYTNLSTGLSTIRNRATNEILRNSFGVEIKDKEFYAISNLKSDDILVSTGMGDTVKLNAVPDAYKQNPLLGRFVYNGEYRDLMSYEFCFYDGHENDMMVNVDENGYIYVDPNGGSARFKLHMTTEEYGAEAIDGKSVKLLKTHYNYTAVVNGDTLMVVKENGRYKLSKTGTPVSFDVMKTTTIDGVDWYSMVDSKNGKKVLVDLTSMNIYEDESSASRTSMFSIISNSHLLFRHIGETIEDGIAFKDTAYVEIFKSDEPSRFLYEDSKNLFTMKSDNVKEGKTFLGIYNNKEYTHNASLFLDTAYVWDEKVMPTYLLAVDAHHYNAGEEIHGYGTEAERECVAAKYLVSLADSTDGSYCGKTRLGFVRGIHVGDSLVISGTNDTLTIARGQLNRGMFAFELVDRIENNPDADFYLRNKDGYVGIMNGVPILVDQKTTAAMFNMYKSDVVPTANEGIDASGVKIIAGKGCVTVRGAAGKTVTVTSMLGRIVEQTVAASDNIQLVAPAGVVIVSVEGETPKKTIIK